MRGKISSPAISGVITLFSVPTTLQVGNEIRVNIDGDLYDYDKAWYEPWYGCFTVERAGYHNYATFDGFGVVIGPEWAPTIGLGPMPDTTVLVTARLWAQPSAWAGTDWDWDRIAELGWVGPVATETKTIIPTGVPPPPECETDSDCVALYGAGYYCEAGRCVDAGGFPPPPPPPKGVDWRLVALGGGALLAGAIIFRVRR